MGKRVLVVTGGKRPQVRKGSKDGWTAAKRARFLEALAETCNIAESLRRVKMGASGLAKLRARDAAFRAGWAVAIREAVARLEVVLLERALNGTVKTVVKAGGQTETMHEYPNAIALQLLRMHRGEAGEGGGFAAAGAAADGGYEEDMEELRKRVMRKLAGVRRRLEREGRAGAADASCGPRALTLPPPGGGGSLPLPKWERG